MFYFFNKRRENGFVNRSVSVLCVCVWERERWVFDFDVSWEKRDFVLVRFKIEVRLER